MYYLTKANYNRLLNALNVDIPYQFEKSYYQQYKLLGFELDLDFFTLPEAKKLVISDIIFQGLSNYANGVIIKKVEQQQQNWVYKLGYPAFHLNEDCEILHRDFENVRIPPSLLKDRVEEYRTYFIDNNKKYGYFEHKIEPTVFCRKLKDVFNLEEEVKDLEKLYFNKTRYQNSEVVEFNATLNFELEASRINTLMDNFKLYVKENAISASFSRQAFLHKTPEKRRNKVFSAREIELMKEIDKHKSAILARILNYHFQYLAKEGINISNNLFKLVGFKCCEHCERG